jgi:NDP-sugar pyrophosphorylase family protein
MNHFSIETFIAAPEDYETPLKQFLNDYKRERMSIELVIVPEILGTADGLRAVSDRIRGDVFVLSADFISQFSVIDLANLHRLSVSDVTMLLAVTPKDAPKEDIDQEYVGISDKGRVLLKTPTLEIDEAIDISKSLLHKCAIFNLRNDLTDIGLYLLSHWVVEYVVNNKRVSSLKNDLVSYLVKRQFQSKEYLHDTFPPIVHRKRPLNGLESLLLNAGKGIGGDLRDQEQQDDLLRCFAVVIDTTAASSVAASALPTPPTPMILSRLNNIPTYLALNK